MTYVRQVSCWTTLIHPYPVEQNVSDTLYSVSPVGSRCHFVLLDKDVSCPAADLSNMGLTNGPAYSTGQLLNMPQDILYDYKVELTGVGNRSQLNADDNIVI